MKTDNLINEIIDVNTRRIKLDSGLTKDILWDYMDILKAELQKITGKDISFAYNIQKLKNQYFTYPEFYI